MKLAEQQKQLALTWKALPEAERTAYYERAETLKAATKPKATAKDRSVAPSRVWQKI